MQYTNAITLAVRAIGFSQITLAVRAIGFSQITLGSTKLIYIYIIYIVEIYACKMWRN